MSDDDSTYRFDPAEFREDGETDDVESEEVTTSDAVEPSRATAPDGEPREFGWRGWILVGMLLVAFVVVPVLLYFVPRAQWLATSIGLSYRDAFLVLPLIPALLLGALAVWATTRP